MVNSDFQGYSNLVESALKLKSRDLSGHINYWDQSIDPQKFFFKYLFPKCNKLDLQWKFLGHKVSLMAQGIYSNSNKNTIVLDVGAGDARYGAFFKKNTYVSTDLVFSSERHNFDNIDIISDVEKLSIANDYADYILNFSLMEHVPHPDLVVKEMFRTLKRGVKYFQ
jgi:SAM-dependent methyltransferase